MAIRHVTRRYDDLAAFLDEYTTTLVHGGVFLPPDSTEGEVSNELKLDIVLPLVGRVGPLTAQVVHRAPDGGVGLRLPFFEQEAGPAVAKIIDAVDQIRSWLLRRGDLVPRKELERRLAELERLPRGDAPMASGGPQARSATRGIPVPDLADEPPAISGTMDDRSFRDAIVTLAVERATGLVTVRANGRVRYGFWAKGGPVAWRTDPVQESEALGVLLFKAGQLTKEQVQESLRIMEESHVRQGEALIDMGVLAFPQLIMVLGKQVEFVLQQAMLERGGTWTFHPLADLPEQFLPPPLRVPSLLFRALVKRAREMRSTELAAVHRPNLDKYVKIPDEVRTVIEEVKLAPMERKLLEVLDSSNWRLRELFSISPLARHVTAAVLWAFDDLGFLSYEDTEDRERYLARVGQRIQRKRQQCEKATLFDVLEVHWISVPQEIKENHDRLVAEFTPATYLDLPPVLRGALDQVNRRIEEAWATLGNDAARREYRKTVVEGFMITQSAELLSKKGEMAMMRHDRREAANCYAKALELIPGHPEYKEGLRRAAAVG